MKRKTWSTLAAAVAIAALSPCAVRADSAPVTATVFPENPSPPNPGAVQPGTTSLSVTFDATTADPHGYTNAFVGQINFYNASWSATNAGLDTQLQLANIPGGASNTFGTYCIEGTQNVYIGETETWNDGVVNLTDAPDGPSGKMTQLQADQITAYWNLFIGQVNSLPTSPLSLTTSKLTGGSLQSGQTFTDFSGTFLNQNALASAFQLGIWEIMSDGNTDTSSTNFFSAGNFQAANPSDAYDKDILQQADSWLGTVFSQSDSQLKAESTSYTVYALTDSAIQDQIFAVPNVGGSPVPLPAALPAGLAGLSLLALGGLFARSRKRLGARRIS